MKANLTEIMESVQGEGLLVGTRQVFLRFAGCNLRCSYCDTVNSLEARPYCKFFPATGRADLWDNLPNPLSIDLIAGTLGRFRAQWISLTGGEPLLWPNFISELSPSLKNQGYKLMLETNGVLYEQLEACLSGLDLISMDFKLPSATGEDNWSNHNRFLVRAADKPVYTKIVVDANSNESEIREAVKILAAVNVNIPLILQPVTPAGKAEPANMDSIMKLQKIAMDVIRDVRIIPQIHRCMGLI
ncbi:MAG: 7-carboxy-7-deazaguanine synthase QueE [Syntrophomonadaceae bacterium]|nr:7-carboxy-7-deazaguanine synthase QueE [Syntrophomonadaceae bacterium]